MTQILFRRGTAVDAANSNPILAEGEPGWEKDTRTFKIGDGVTPWLELEPVTSGGGTSPHDHNGDYAPLNHNHDAVYIKATEVRENVVLTQAEFDALPATDGSTLYYIQG